MIKKLNHKMFLVVNPDGVIFGAGYTEKSATRDFISYINSNSEEKISMKHCEWDMYGKSESLENFVLIEAMVECKKKDVFAESTYEKI